MKYGQISESTNTNTAIYHCFEYICEQDQRKFVSKFRHQPHDSSEVVDTLQELFLGAYLNSKGFAARYDYQIDNQTPDWTILDEESKAITAIIESTSFHIDRTTQAEIQEKRRTQKIITYWRDAYTNNKDRLWYTIDRKATTYKSLIDKLRIPYIVSVFTQFEAAIDFDEVRSCLSDTETGLFNTYTELSGVLHFSELRRGLYVFNYAINPNALHAMDLPSDTFHPQT